MAQTRKQGRSAGLQSRSRRIHTLPHSNGGSLWQLLPPLPRTVLGFPALSTVVCSKHKHQVAPGQEMAASRLEGSDRALGVAVVFLIVVPLP